MAVESRTVDVAVAGAGMAGLTAAVRATEFGADVLVLEKGPQPGGSMALSAGLVWSYGTVEAARENVPRGDPAIQRLVVDRLDGAFEWLERLGVEVREPPVELPTGDTVTAPTPGANCGKIDPEAFVDAATAAVRDAGGDVLTGTPMTGLSTDDAGAVDGVCARRDDGATVRVAADAVVLATGGFQGNRRLVRQYVTDAPENLWLRANPWSTGDGLTAAVEAGAAVTGGLDTFYGHNMAAPPAEVGPDTFLEATQYYGPLAVALDRDGRRFTDESESDLEHTLAQDTARLAGGRAYYVLDRDLYDAEVFSMGHVGTIVERAEELGGRVLRGETLPDLGEALSAAGADGDAAVETVRRFNEAIRQGRADELDPPRRDNHRTVDAPPFYAVSVQPGITFTMGGVAVDVDARVRCRAATPSRLPGSDAGGSQSGQPVPGLYAAGADVGGANHRHYLGGLAAALVTGWVAGENAADAAGEDG